MHLIDTAHAEAERSALHARAVHIVTNEEDKLWDQRNEQSMRSPGKVDIH